MPFCILLFPFLARYGISYLSLVQMYQLYHYLKSHYLNICHHLISFRVYFVLAKSYFYIHAYA